MRRFLAVLVLLATLVSFGPRPAAAHEDVCVGEGVMVTSSPVYYPTVGPSALASFTMTMSPGICMAGLTYSMTGILGGHCLFMNGWGVTNVGHSFAFDIVGVTMTFRDEVTGTAEAQSDYVNGHSCMSGTTHFRVRFAHLLFALDGDPPPPNAPPHTPTLVAPADGASFTTADVPVFTVNTTDPDGDSYVATIEVQEIGSTTTQVMTTAPAPSGSDASTSSGNLPPGNYQWRAMAGDFSASSGWSDDNTFTVTLI